MTITLISSLKKLPNGITKAKQIEVAGFVLVYN